MNDEVVLDRLCKVNCMEKYIEGNKAAWEEAFDKRDASWGADITERIQKEDYPF